MKILVKNKRAKYDFEIKDEIEVGLKLNSYEVKPILKGSMSLVGSWVSFDKETNQLKLKGSRIDVDRSNIQNFIKIDEDRDIILLIRKNQMLKFKNKADVNGFSLIIKDVYYNDKNKIKATLCLVNGKNQRDKRNDIKDRQSKIQMNRDFKNNF